MGSQATVHVYKSSHAANSQIRLRCTNKWVDAVDVMCKGWFINDIQQTTSGHLSDCKECIVDYAKTYSCSCSKLVRKLADIIEGRLK